MTSEEMAQFTSRFNLEAHQANIIIRVCTFVFSKALENQASEQVSPFVYKKRKKTSCLLYDVVPTFCFCFASLLSKQELAMSLKEGGVQEKHCLAFATAWNREKDQLLKRIKKESFGAPAALESVDWKVHLQVKGSEADVEQIIPKAVFELLLQDQQKDGTAAKSISMELNRQELERLYNNFEEIQGQLDALT